MSWCLAFWVGVRVGGEVLGVFLLDFLLGMLVQVNSWLFDILLLEVDFLWSYPYVFDVTAMCWFSERISVEGTKPVAHCWWSKSQSGVRHFGTKLVLKINKQINATSEQKWNSYFNFLMFKKNYLTIAMAIDCSKSLCLYEQMVKHQHVLRLEHHSTASYCLYLTLLFAF